MDVRLFVACFVGSGFCDKLTARLDKMNDD
jgi:hypothetical protein